MEPVRRPFLPRYPVELPQYPGELFTRGLRPPPGMFTLVLVEQGLLRTGPRSFPAGALILFPPPAPARLEQPGTRLRAFCFGRSLVDPLAFDASATRIVEMLGAAGPVAARLSGQAFAEARALFDRLEREDEARAPGFEAMVRLKVMEALLLLSRGLGPAAARSGVSSRFDVEEAKSWIQNHHADPLSLEQIAALFGHNPSYFSRLFHREAGVPLVEYINRVRIQHSCQLLKRSNAGIMEIATAVGYNNISHFNRFFRRLMDMSPREYRISSRK